MGDTRIARTREVTGVLWVHFRQLAWEGVGFVSTDIVKMLASYLFTYATYLMCYSRP